MATVGRRAAIAQLGRDFNFVARWDGQHGSLFTWPTYWGSGTN